MTKWGQSLGALVLGAWCEKVWYNFNNEGSDDMNNEQNKMNNEPNKPIEAEELTEKELEGVVGGARPTKLMAQITKVTYLNGLNAQTVEATYQFAR